MAENRSVIARDWGWRKELTTLGCKGTFWADGNALQRDCAGGYLTVMSLSKLIELYIKGEFYRM